MPDPVQLLALARELVAKDKAAPSDAHVRRAVSTAYYALFHAVLRAAADRFVGAAETQSAAFAIVYRSFDHGHMRTMCVALNVTVLKGELRQRLLRDSVGADARRFAANFVELQLARQRADYDPHAAYTAVDAAILTDGSEAAIAAFGRIPPEEQRDLLALLLARGRALAPSPAP
jgi:hypothetical protein